MAFRVVSGECSYQLPAAPPPTSSPVLRIWVLCSDRSAGAFLLRTSLALTFRAEDLGQRLLPAPRVPTSPSVPLPLPSTDPRPRLRCGRRAGPPAGRR
jgi:hypothetical protein